MGRCLIFSMVLFAWTALAGSGRESALIIFDTSGSMRWTGNPLDWHSLAFKQPPPPQRPKGTGMVAPTRFDHAQRMAGEAVERFEKKGYDLGLIVFGQGPCERIDLMVQLGGDYAGRAVQSAVLGLHPTGLTPIADSLKKAAEYIKNGGYNVKEVLLITDGMETCKGNPKEAARELRKLGAKVNIIGLDTAGAMSAQLEEVAAEGGGTFEEQYAVGAGGDRAEGGSHEVGFAPAGPAPRAFVPPANLPPADSKIWMPPAGGIFPDEQGTRIKY